MNTIFFLEKGRKVIIPFQDSVSPDKLAEALSLIKVANPEAVLWNCPTDELEALWQSPEAEDGVLLVGNDIGVASLRCFALPVGAMQ